MHVDENYLKSELYNKIRTDPVLFEFLQASVLDGLWYWDIERPDEEWLSPGFKKLFGYKDHEVPNTSKWWKQHINPEDLPKVLNNFKLHLKNPDHPYDQIVRYQHKAGKTIWVRCRGLAIRDKSGRPIRMLGAHVDVTALKNAEIALTLANRELQEQKSKLGQQTKLLKESNQHLEQFTRVASHDMKQPLRTIKSFSELLQQKLQGNSSEDVRDYLNFITSAIDQLQGMLNGLLEQATLNQDSADTEVIKLDYLAKLVVDGLAVSIREHNASIDVRALPAFRCNEKQMWRLIQNLIQNGLMNSKSEPVRLRISAETDDKYLTLMVDDNGPGIPPDKRENVFQEFYKLDVNSSGAGMGLSICKNIARRHGGQIWVEDSDLGGASFRVKFPLHSEEIKAA